MIRRCSVTSAFLDGVEAVPVTVEVAVSSGLPGMSIVGMVDNAVQEARERVITAIRSSGFEDHHLKVVVNIAPGGIRKSGSGFDLPIALGILGATMQMDTKVLKNRLFIGELSLDGRVREVVGSLPYGTCAYKMGYGLVSGSAGRLPIDGLEQYRLETLGRLRSSDPLSIPNKHGMGSEENLDNLDFKDIAGHEVAKRVLQIAAAGTHGVLMMGPPGSGKTMLARRLPSILPKLGQYEMLEAASVHSVCGEDIRGLLEGNRPIRAPHHSASIAGLLGGGTPVRPGEASLAHCGVLFLDELAEFKPSVLQGLRQPMESGEIVITRRSGNVKLPARFMLVAASNPCPCGYFGDEFHDCACTEAQVGRYQSRIGGPLLDRIDLQIDVHRLPPKSVLETGNGETSESMRSKVGAAREFALSREKAFGLHSDGSSLQKQGSPREIVEACGLTGGASRFLISMAESLEFSGRSIMNVLKVARTIADLEQTAEVKEEHVAEAIGYRLNEAIGG